VGPNYRRPSVKTLRNYARIGRLRFGNGYTSYIELLDPERSLFNAEFSQVQTTGSLFQALVNLFKMIGGGRMGFGSRPRNEHNNRFEDPYKRL
jgi:outer membrane protein TolC